MLIQLYIRFPQACCPWLVLLLLFTSLSDAHASHLIAAEITAKQDTTANPNPLRFFFKMVIYTDRASAADDMTITILNGDGATHTVPRGIVRQISADTDQEVFTWERTFPGPGTYTISWLGSNRRSRILNVAAPSDVHSFYIATTLNINPFRGFNSTPVLTNPPVHKASVGKVFVHNPGAYDTDGDSLSFKLIPPRGQAQNSTNIVTIPGYTLPNNLFNCPNATNTGSSIFTMDPVTGQLVWDAPCRAGDYGVAYVVEEWRKAAGGGVIKIGEVVRDMVIKVLENPNSTPALTVRDTCIVAGTTLTAHIRASDPDGDQVNLFARSGILPRANFSQTSAASGQAAGLFTWTPTCADVRAQPHQVLFVAADVRTNAAETLADQQLWNIKVIAPPPQNLAVSASGNNLQLNWENFNCQEAATIRIYRRVGSARFTPEQCQTGVPASTGYTLIGEVPKDATSFLDTNNGQDLSPIRQYCYMITAVFPSPKNGQSIASAEVCAPIRILSTEAEALEQLVQVYPNPAQGRLQVQIGSSTSWESLRIFNTAGMVVQEMQGNGQAEINLELPQAATGLHLLQINTRKGVVTKRVLLY